MQPQVDTKRLAFVPGQKFASLGLPFQFRLPNVWKRPHSEGVIDTSCLLPEEHVLVDLGFLQKEVEGVGHFGYLT